jgi:hypothetical protein
LQLDVAAALGEFQAFIVLVNGNGQTLFRLVLADDIFVQERLYFRGLWQVRPDRRGAVCSSSLIISLQISMHSLQTYTPGPAMSFRTSFCDLPQNEQVKSSSGRRYWVISLVLWFARGRCSLPKHLATIPRTRSFLSVLYHLVDQAVSFAWIG